MQFIDKVTDVPVSMQRQVPTVHMVQKTVEVPAVPFMDRVVDMPVVMQRRAPMALGVRGAANPAVDVPLVMQRSIEAVTQQL